LAILSECQELGAAKPSGLAVTSDAAIGQKRHAAARWGETGRLRRRIACRYQRYRLRNAP